MTTATMTAAETETTVEEAKTDEAITVVGNVSAITGEEKPSYDHDLDALAAEFAEVKETIEKLNKRKSVIGDRILDLLGVKVTVKTDNGYTVTTVAESERVVVDTARLKREYPDIASECSKLSKTKAFVKVAETKVKSETKKKKESNTK